MNTLPSKHQIGDIVTLTIGKNAKCLAEVVNVHFSHKKVRYDLSIEVDFNIFDPEDNISDWTGYNVEIATKIGHTRLYNVDSLLVS